MDWDNGHIVGQILQGIIDGHHNHHHGYQASGFATLTLYRSGGVIKGI